MTDVKSDYWNEFYTSRIAKTKLDLPSQFAVFFLGETEEEDIVDFGCGTGRDALFFASCGRRVTGVDGSQSAVDLCQDKASQLGYDNARFLCADLGSGDTLERLKGINGSTALYARFFLHAITDEEERVFMDIAKSLIGNSVLALEFRTARDEQQAKVTPSHYRRFVNPLDFLGRAAKLGLVPIYFAEGFGYAKYKHDDAHVARVILRSESAA